MTAQVSVSAVFDSGNIEVVDAASPDNIRLRVRDDAGGEHRQWFHFRVSGARGVPLTLHIDNASQCSYPGGWPDYRVCMSDDHVAWRRVADTRYDGTRLTIRLTPENDLVWLAYFEPYSWERHQALIGRCAASPLAGVERLGASVEGRDIDCVRIGTGAAPVWIIARQHPGESMAEWLAEGLLETLLGDSAAAVAVRRHATVHVVPNMNPDGSVRGHLRCNAAGANLNREWLAPMPGRSPEVLCVQQAMRASGVGFFLDVHGDETIPHVFIDGAGMVPGYGETNIRREKQFCDTLDRISPRFQQTHGYHPERFGEEMLSLASKWVAYVHGCVSMTLEMPFKDHNDDPQPETGWNGERSKLLGADIVTALAEWLG
ncbi:MAG: carboxypeptidase family protein [Rhodocyclaceae bacterium]|nr:carboxypeptidase family protein [Rhodocyclaceae bacterium]